jgi:NAD-reducing hydrogenase large subunit
MAGITVRICGICPVSHLMASAKTGDAILAVTIPPAAAKLRRLMNLAQIVQSHALSFFHLSAPDLLLGFDSDPAQRNIFGLMAQQREIARQGIRAYDPCLSCSTHAIGQMPLHMQVVGADGNSRC